METNQFCLARFLFLLLFVPILSYSRGQPSPPASSAESRATALARYYHRQLQLPARHYPALYQATLRQVLTLDSLQQLPAAPSAAALQRTEQVFASRLQGQLSSSQLSALLTLRTLQPLAATAGATLR